MVLFGKKRQEFPPLFSAEETAIVNFNSVLEYLEGLSADDYEKVLRVARIYRTANKGANKVLGIKDEPTVAIDKESHPGLDFLFEDKPVKTSTVKVSVNKDVTGKK